MSGTTTKWCDLFAIGARHWNFTCHLSCRIRLLVPTGVSMNTNTVLMIVIVVAVGVAMFVVT